jgi:hypothetical protein
LENLKSYYLEIKFPIVWIAEKQSRAEAEEKD